MSPMAGSNGYRRVVRPGNVNHNLSWRIKQLPADKTFYWSVQAIDNSFAGGEWAEEKSFSTGLTGTVSRTDQLPAKFSLAQNYPNPFNPSTKIVFFLAVSQHVKIDVYNIVGQKIRTIIDEQQGAGRHEIEFNAENLLSSGIYFYHIKSGEFQDVKKMILLR